MNEGTSQAGIWGYLEGPGGLGPWVRTRDHKRIGLMFIGWTTGALLLGCLFSLLLMVKSLGGMGADPGVIYQAMTYQRLIMVFMFLVPAIPAGLGHFLLPLQLGARDLALPRFSQWSLRLYVAGLLLVVVSVLFGPVASGWIMATPLSLGGGGLFTLLCCGLACLGLSWFVTGVNFVVTVHHRRAAGMGFFAMPILAWSLYLGGFLLVGSGLVFSIIVLYLAASRAAGSGLFGPTADPLLWLDYFWVAVRPAMWAALIPALGIVTEVIAGISRKAVAGYRMVVGAMIALLALGTTTWGAHLAGWGQAPATTFVFSVLTLATAIPLALLAYSWLATLHRGAVACAAPTTCVIAFLWNGGVAVLLGLFLASPAPGLYLGTTMFATAHWDYLVWGAAMAAYLAGLQYWWPKISGRQINQQVGRFGVILYLLGMNMTFFPQIIQGVRGAPMDLGALEPGPNGLSEVAGLGWMFLIFGLGVVLGNLVSVFWSAEPAARNPWGASTLEWRTGSPPPVGNFAMEVEAGAPYLFPDIPDFQDKVEV